MSEGPISHDSGQIMLFIYMYSSSIESKIILNEKVTYMYTMYSKTICFQID